jgi:chromosome segregation ATPase
MSNSRDSSLWRSLAVAFGDGLAFGVGMKITQNAAPRQPPRESTLDRLEERLRRLERGREISPASIDERIVEGLVNGVEARLQEQGAQVERRLADLETHLAVEIKSLDQQDRTLARSVGENIESLRTQVVELNREFAAQVARIVGEQVDAVVEKRLREVEQRLAPLREELERKNQEIAELRQRTQDTDTAVFDFVASMGQLCRDAAGRFGAPREVPPATPSTPPEAEAEADPDPVTEVKAPSFGELKRPSGLWRMPMVSSLIVAAGGAALLAHYL